MFFFPFIDEELSLVSTPSWSGLPSPASAFHPTRARELASLYATARSLTALGELDDVLQSIVHHAHELIGTDFTYLSLLDPEGELQVRAAEGTISADLRAASIPSAIGLGGKVIGQRTPFWVRDYLEASDITHDVDFDSVVVREGMVALLGVPLVIRDRAIGALFASDRSPRDFTSDEIALLCAFADHAAVALDNARLYDQSQQALHELRGAYRTIEENIATMEQAQSIHEALTHVVLTGGGPDEVARQLADRLGGTVSVLRRDDMPVAVAVAGTDADAVWTVSPRQEGESGPLTPEVAVALRDARSSRRSSSEIDVHGTVHSVAVVQAGDSYLGALVWSRRGESSSSDLRLLERASHIVGLMVLKENAVTDAAERLSGELLTELLVSSPEVSETQRARTQARGLDVDSFDLLVVVESQAAPTSTVSRVVHGYAREVSGLSGEYLGRVTMLMHADDPEAALAQIHRTCQERLGHPVTLIGERAHGGNWARAFATATRCHVLAKALGHVGESSMTSRFAPFSLLIDPDRVGELDDFLAEAIGPLVEYDERRSTDLVRTATAYFANHGNLAQTARELHVHLNTLLKRLERVTVLLGDQWRGLDSLRINLACRLHELATSTEDQAGAAGAHAGHARR